jgi:hypothetical protein
MCQPIRGYRLMGYSGSRYCNTLGLGIQGLPYKSSDPLIVRIIVCLVGF